MKKIPIAKENISIERIEDKCVDCGLCKKVCKEYIGIADTYEFNKDEDIVCINCGQCANVCPVNAIVEKMEVSRIKKHIQDEDKIVIFNTSPSVRISLGEEFGLEHGSFVEGKMISLLRNLGGNYVLDTNFSADLTIMEEASELVNRIVNNKPLPQFTSCCPAWVNFAEIYHPNIIDNISSVKSPIGMQGATVKTYFCKMMGIDPSKVINVAVTPCTAKKAEIRREEMKDASIYLGVDNMRDMDYVITTRELATWAKNENIDFNNLDNSKFDDFMGEASGAGVIFGASGGVMEAALRTAYKLITNETAPENFYELKSVRGLNEFKEANILIGDLNLKIAVIYGTNTVNKYMDKLLNDGYHFVEVMTCPGGCIGGGGQPKNRSNQEVNNKRIEGLYKKDNSMKNRLSHENEQIKKLYDNFYEKPLSEIAEQLLHTSYKDKSNDYKLKKKGETMETENKVVENTQTTEEKYICTVCNYVHEGPLPADFECPLCHLGIDVFEKID